MTHHPLPPADALVMFGITGDLSKRKLFPALYHLERRGALGVPVVGVSRSGWTVERFAEHARAAIAAAIPDARPNVVDRLCGRLRLIDGDYRAPDTFATLAACLDDLGSSRAVFYLAIPPEVFETVVAGLTAAGLNTRGRVMVEKPFGRDQASARALNGVLLASFPEEQILRIDHYLGKESVEDLLVFRFANSFLEPIWNRRYVDNVQVTMAERIGVEGRGRFYDDVGALRDVVQNHVLQVVTFLAMEPPVGPSSDNLQDEKAKVLAATRPVDTTSYVRGQYRGYRTEPGVAPDSTTETFAALRLDIESWRWAGVPFYVRAGKALAQDATEVVVELREPPRLLFEEDGGAVSSPNLVRFRLGRHDGVTLTVQAKTPGRELRSEAVDMSVDFAAALGERREPYERLLDDALVGSRTRFARHDLVELEWAVVEPALHAPGPIRQYERGTWGPPAADAILAGRHWHPPSGAR